MREIYFDNSATTRAYPEVVEIVTKVMLEDYGNPSSLHNKGLDAEHYVRDAAKIVAKHLKCQPEEIIFTSGGTESNNMAIIGSVLARRRHGKHIVVSSIEHASVLSVMAFLQNEGYEVTYVGTDASGHVNPEEFAAAVREDTILASCMHVNNEIGSVQPIAEIAKLIKEKNKDIYFHVDCIQSFGKIPVIPKTMGADLISVSGHKIHGPKGSGFLYVKKGLLIRPIIYGGGQQKGMRSGTENVPGIAGLGKAIELTFTNFDEKMTKVSALKQHLVEELTKLPEVFSNSHEAPHIASISFVGVRAEVMLHTLENEGIFVSSGSACSSNKKRESAVLTSIGLDEPKIESTLRFSFGEDNTMEEVDEVVAVINRILPMLRHYVRG